MSTFSEVYGYQNGKDQPLNAETLNVPINQLKQRTQYLHDMFNIVYKNASFESVRNYNVGSAEPIFGLSVVRITTKLLVTPAIATATPDTITNGSLANGTAYAAGVYNPETKTLFTSGKITYTKQDIERFIEPGQTFVPGSYYLSAVIPGKITRAVGNVAIYIGEFTETEAIININAKDNYQAHTHKTFTLSSQDSGYVITLEPPVVTYAAAGGGHTIELGGTYLGTDTASYTFKASNQDDQYLFTWTSDKDSGKMVLPVQNVDYAFGVNGLTVRRTANIPTEVLTATIPELGNSLRGWYNRSYNIVMMTETDSPVMLILRGSCTDTGVMGKIISAYTNAHNKLVIEGITAAPFEVADAITGNVDITIDAANDWNLLVRTIDDKPATTVVGQRWAVTPRLADNRIMHLYAYTLDNKIAPYYPPSPMHDSILSNAGVELDALDEFGPNTGDYEITYNSIGTTALFNQVRLHTSYMRSNTTGIVTGLRSAVGSTVRIVDAKTGEPASSGDLAIEVDLGIKESDVIDSTGHIVVKGVDTDGRLVRGPVIESIVGGPGVVVSTNKGVTSINVPNSGVTYGDFSDTTLLGARYEILPGSDSMLTFIKLSKWDKTSVRNTNSGFVSKFRVPLHLTGNYKVVLQATMFGLAASTVDSFAGLEINYASVADYATTTGGNITTPLDAPVKGSVLVDVPFNQGYVKYDPFILTNDTVPAIKGQVVTFDLGITTPVTAGDIVAIKISRASATGVEYKEEVGFLSATWKLVQVGA